MKALVKTKPAPGAEIMELNIPEPGVQDVLIKVLATSICGTDLHIYQWDKWARSRVKAPLIIGHEMAGEIVDVGEGVTSYKAGDYVSVECHKTCGICYQCRTGQAHICSNYTILGVDFDGCFAEYVVAPQTNIWKNDLLLPPETACLQDPVGNAVLAVLGSNLTAKSVLITGCGAIGLIAVGLARVAGAVKIYASDINRYRLNLAEKMGATLTVNPLEEDISDRIFNDNDGCGVDFLIEMSGKESALKSGLKLLKNGGRAALLGLPEGEVSLDLVNDVIFKGISLVGITGREIFNTWYKTAALLKGVLDVNPIITHRMKIEEYEEAFAIMQRGDCGKIILYP
jgi:threonine 3-dehydrogenase